MNYGKAMRVARAARGISQKDLAERSELNASYISLLESNRRVPSGATLDAIARGLQVPLYLLMLIASEDGDLHGLGVADAQVLGQHLLELVINHGEEGPQDGTGKLAGAASRVGTPPRRTTRHNS